VNGKMPEHVVRRVVQSLNQRKRGVNGSRILVMGVAYKANIDDVRESPSLDVMELLHEMGGKVEYADPHVPSLDLLGRRMKAVAPTAARLRRADCVVLTAAHRDFDYALILRASRAIVDTRNAFKGKRSPKIIRL